MARLTREFSSDLRQLAAMREYLREACRGCWDPEADEGAIAPLELALDEAASNVILHAYRGEAGRPIELAVDVDADRACVELYHRGRDFDPDAVPPPDLDALRESGRGLYLIRQSVDEVTFFRDDQGRCGVRLVKHRR
jgi:anti-sigma regulatory factor (Ser/Thr protein kinase)